LRATTKKWLAHGAEFTFFLVFAGFGLLLGNEIKQDWAANKVLVWPPSFFMGWAGAGLAYGLSRVLAGRFGREEARSVLSAPAFIERYRKMLAAAIQELVETLQQRKAIQELDSFEKTLLKAMANTIRYFRSASILPNPEVTCNLMEAVEPSPEHENNPWLEPSGFGQLLGVLKIEKSSREDLDVPANLALPIYKTDGHLRNKNLFGAPKAYITRENQIINFSLWLLPHKGNSSWPVFKRAYRHFWEIKATCLSFAALPVIYSGKSVAVVNVHYKWFRILGKNPEILIDFLVPFLLILGQVRGARELEAR